jgi:ribosomal protein L11
VGEVKPSSAITAVLGQNQINMINFFKEFNDLTKNIESGIELPVKVFKFSDKSYKIQCGVPTYQNLIYSVLETKRSFLKLEEFYDLIKIREQFLKSEFKKELNIEESKNLVKSLLSTLDSMKMSVKYKIKLN